MFFATRGGHQSESEALPNAFEVAKETVEQPSSPTPPVPPAKAPEPRPAQAPAQAQSSLSPVAVLPPAFDAEPAFGAYPAGLQVPIPDWLRRASVEGGKLVTVPVGDDTPPHSESLDLGKAGQFDDFVALFSAEGNWFALRKNGDLWGRLFGHKDVLEVGPIALGASPGESSFPLFTREDGTVVWYLDAVTIEDKDPPHGTKQVIGNHGRHGRQSNDSEDGYRLFLDAKNRTLDLRGSLDLHNPPPADFFGGTNLLAATIRTVMAIDANGNFKGWHLINGKPLILSHDPDPLVDISSSNSWSVLLQANGRPVVVDDKGEVNHIDQAPPGDLGPVVRLRADGNMVFAQRPDGTWSGWAMRWDSVDQTSVNSSIRTAESLGPALDVAMASNSKIEKWNKTFRFLVAIRPKTAATPEPALTSAAPTVAAPPVVPDWLVAARKTGGRVRFFGTAPKNASERGPIPAFNDVVDIAMDGMGFAARRADGETHSIVWRDEIASGGLLPPVAKTPRLPHGHVVGLWSETEPGYHLLWAEQFIPIKGISHPDADRIVHTQYHLTALDPDGEILSSIIRVTGMRSPRT